jgi:hypothetical protein
VDGKRSTHERDEKIFWLGNLRIRDHPEDLSVGGWLI